MLVAFNHCLTLIPMNLLTTVTQLFWRHTAPFINRLHTPLKQFLTMSPFSRNVLPCNDSIQSNLWTLAGGSSGSGSGSGWSCRTFPQLTHDREAVSTGPGHQDTGMGSWLKRILMEVVLRSSFIDKTCLATIAISFEADLLKKYVYIVKDGVLASLICEVETGVSFVLPGLHLHIASSVVPSVLVCCDKSFDIQLSKALVIKFEVTFAGTRHPGQWILASLLNNIRLLIGTLVYYTCTQCAYAVCHRDRDRWRRIECSRQYVTN